VIGRYIVYPSLAFIGKTWNAQRLKGTVDVAQGDDKAGRFWVTVYYAKCAFAINDGKVRQVDRVWFNDFPMDDFELEPEEGELFPAEGVPEDESAWYVVPGTSNQTATAEAEEAGFSRVVPYRHTALLVWSGELGEMNRLPTVAMEVVADQEQICEKTGSIDSGLAAEDIGAWFGYDEETGKVWATIGAGSSRTKRGLVTFDRFDGTPTYTDPPSIFGDAAVFGIYWGYTDKVILVSDVFDGKRFFATGRHGDTASSGNWVVDSGPALSAESIGAWAFDPYEGVLFLYFSTSKKILAYDVNEETFSELDVSGQFTDFSAFAGLFFDHEYKRLAFAYKNTDGDLVHVDVEIEESSGAWAISSTDSTTINAVTTWGGAPDTLKGLGRVGELWTTFDITNKRQLLYTTTDEADVAPGPDSYYAFSTDAAKDPTSLLTRSQILMGSEDDDEPYLHAPTDALFDHRSQYLWIRDTDLSGRWLFVYSRWAGEDFSYIGKPGYHMRIFTREGSPAGAMWLIKNHPRIGEGVHESRINLRSFEDAEGWAMEFCQVGQGEHAFFEHRHRADVLMDSLEDSTTYIREIETACGMRLTEFDGQLYLTARRPARRILCEITDSKIERGKLTYSYAGMTERSGNAVRVEFMNRTNETAMNLPWRIDVIEVVYLQEAESVRGTKVVQTVRSRATIDRSVAYRLGEQTLLASIFERLRTMFPTTGELLLAAPGDHFYLTTALIPNCTKKVMRFEEITEDNERELQIVAVEQCDDAYRKHIYQQDPTDQRETVLGDYGIYMDSASGLSTTFVPWPARAIAIDRPNERRGVVQFLYSRGEKDRHLVDIAIHTSDGRDASSFAVFAASAHLHASISESDTTIQISMASLLDDGTRGETFVEGFPGTIWIASYSDNGGVRQIGAVEAVTYTNFEIVTVGGEEIGQFTGCKRGALNTSPAVHTILTASSPLHMVEDPVRETWDVNFPKPYVLGYGDKRTGVNDASYVYFGANAKFNEIVFSNLIRSNPEYRIYVNEMEYGASEDSVVWKRAVGLCDETDDFMNLNATQQRRIITFEAGMDWKLMDVNSYNRYWVRFEKTVTVPHTRHGYGLNQIPQEMDQAITLRLCPIVYKHVPWPTSYEYPREDQRQNREFEVAGIARWSQASSSTQNPLIRLGIGEEFGDRGMYSGDMDLGDDSEELKKGDGVYIGFNGKAYKLDAASPEDVKAWLGFATENVQPGERVTGKVDVDGTAYNDSWAMTAGSEVYVDFANKTLTQTRPTGQYTIAGIATREDELQMTINGDMGREWLLLRWHKELLTSDDDDPVTPHYPLSHKARENPILIFAGGVIQTEGSGDPASLDSTVYGFVPDDDRRGIRLTWKPDPGTGVLAVYLIEED
jgi:hypothetical protein